MNGDLISKMRRPAWASLFVLLVISLLAAGCGGAATQAPPPAEGEAEQPPAEQPGGSITFMAPPWAVVEEETLQAWSEQSGITVETIAIPNEQVYERVQVSLGSRAEPADVIFLSEEAPSFIVTSGAVMPLDDFIARDGFDLNQYTRTEFWQRDGQQYGITAYLQFPMLDYNANRLEQAGYTEPPTTWDEFREMAIALKEQGVDNYPVSFSAISWSWYLVALPMGDPLFDENLNPTFNGADAPGRRAMNYLVDLYAQDLISPEQLTQRDPHAIFSAGVGTLHQSWLGAHVVFNNTETSKQAPDVRYALLPEEHWTWGFDSAIGISTFSDNQEAAWEFVKFYLDDQVQQHLFDAFGLLPAKISVQESINQSGKNQQPEVQEEQAKYVRQLPRQVAWWGEWDSFVTETIRRAFQDEITADEAVDLIAEKWNELKS